MLAGELYSAADAELTAERERCQALLTRLNATPVGHEGERSRIVRQLFAPIHIVEQSEHQPHSAHSGAAGTPSTRSIPAVASTASSSR